MCFTLFLFFKIINLFYIISKDFQNVMMLDRCDFKIKEKLMISGNDKHDN